MDIVVYIIADTSFPESIKRKFDKLASKYDQQIKFIQVDDSRFKAYPTKGMNYWTVAVYYRLLAAELLPESIDRVLYLDCDTILTGSLKYLQELNMANQAVGAVDDICYNDKENFETLCYPCCFSYFNAGVILINLQYWRIHNVQENCLDYLFSNYNKITANDQDVLNAVLYDKVNHLPLLYNFQVLFLKKELFDSYPEQMQQRIMDTHNPIIIHYAMQTKPWDIRYYKLPFSREWNYYKRLSPWWYYLPLIPKEGKLKFLIKRYLLWPLGIMRNWPGREFIY